jgi:hypothetical protein
MAGNGRVGLFTDTEEELSPPQPSSPKVKITNGASHLQNAGEGGSPSILRSVADNGNPFTDFAFDKLPTELLVKIFHHTRADNVLDACETKYTCPVALAQVCRHWRNVALGAPTLWTDIRIVQYDTEGIRTARFHLERSRTCPIFLTWFSLPLQTCAGVQGVINDLVIPGAERWQRITLLADDKAAAGALLAAMESLDFPILQDVEISCMTAASNPIFRCNAPLLRRCRFRNIPSLPPLPSNLAVLDYVPSAGVFGEFDLDPLLEFLPHVAHSLEHLRFGPPPSSEVRFTPRTSRIPLEHLKSLFIQNSHVIMNHISTPNLTYFAALRLHSVTDTAKMFEGFPASTLRSIQFHDCPLLPILNAYNFPSIFPRLESIALSGCTGELTFALLLEPPKPKQSSSSQKAPKHSEIQNPFPNLKELMVSDMTIWTSLQAAIEKRLKNGDKSLKKIQLPKKEATEAIMLHLRRWLPAQGIELVLYEPGRALTPMAEFQDDFYDEEARLFSEFVEQIEWETHDEEDIDQYDWDGFYDGYDDDDDDEEEEEEDDGFDNLYF